MRSLSAIITSADEISLFKSPTLAFAAEVADEAFRGRDVTEISKAEMIQIIRNVRSRLREEEGDLGMWQQEPEVYLSLWVGSNREIDGGLWFVRERDAGNEVIRLHAHARRVLEILHTFDIRMHSFGVNAMNGLITKIRDTAGRMSGDPVQIRANAQRERDRYDRVLAELDAGEMPETMTEDQASSSINEILKMMSDIVVAFSEVPEEMRKTNKENAKTLAQSQGPVAETVREVLSRNAKMKEGGGYRFMQELMRLNANPDVEKELLWALRGIEKRSAPLIGERESRRISSFLSDMQSIATQTLEGDRITMEQQEAYICSPSYQKRHQESLALRRVQEQMLRIRDDLHPSIRDTRLRGVGLLVSKPLSLLPSSGFRLALTAPDVALPRRVVAETTQRDDTASREQTNKAIKASASSDIDSLARKLAVVIAAKGPLYLSQVLQAFSNVSQEQEIATWLALAASRAPSEYEPGRYFSIDLEGETSRRITLPDPLFTQTGAPGVGIKEALQHLEKLELEETFT